MDVVLDILIGVAASVIGGFIVIGIRGLVRQALARRKENDAPQQGKRR